MKTGVVAIFTALLFAGFSEGASTLTDSGTTVQTITSLGEVDQILKATQWQFWKLVPPATDDPFYLHPERIVRVVDWGSKEWPKPFLKQMYAELDPVGTYGAMYPFYRLTVVEDRSGDLVYYNAYDQEVWRTSAPADYNPYLFAFLTYGVDTADDLTYQQQVFGRSSNVGTEIWLLPLSFASLYEEDAAMDSTAMRLATEPLVSEESLMMTTSSIPEPPGGGGTNANSTASVTNIPATLTFHVPSGFGSSTAEIFQCTNLVSVVSWDIGVESIAVTGGTDLVWTDMASSNIPCRFYILNDPSEDYDLDGLNDGRERYVWRTDYTLPDTDFDGLWDGWETDNGFNPLSMFWEDEADRDSDQDGFTNLEEFEGYSDPLDHFSIPAGVTALYVSDSDGSDTNAGSFFSPFKTIGKGIVEATNGCRVVVRPGTYIGTTNKNLHFSGKDISVVGLVADDPVVIDCENVGGGFIFDGGETTNALLREISIANAAGSGISCTDSSPTIVKCIVYGASDSGMSVQGSTNQMVSSCIFSGNGGSGIGVSGTCLGFSLIDSTLSYNTVGAYLAGTDTMVEGCSIENNIGQGGLYVFADSCIISNSAITGNQSFYHGGGMYLMGDALLRNVEISGNVAAMEGGGIFHYLYGNLVVDSCTIRSNTSVTGGGVYSDMDSYFGTSDVRIENSIIVENSSTGTNWYEGGGGLWLYGFNGNSFEIMNCTIASNSNAYAGGGFLLWSDDVTVTNSIFWGNAPDQIYRKGGLADVSYCCIEGGFEGGIEWIYNSNDPLHQYPKVTGTNNISGDPLLVPYYYRLSSGSSCIGMGSVQGAPSLDIDGENRGTPPDIGADEYSATDSDGDGLPDWMERLHGTDPAKADTDQDGLSDNEEISIYHTDALYPDSDRDGLTDYAEVVTYGTDPNKADTDGDGMNDANEIAYGFSPVSNDSGCAADTDGDGLSDFYECFSGSNPWNDSDPAQGSLTLDVLYPLDTQVLN